MCTCEGVKSIDLWGLMYVPVFLGCGFIIGMVARGFCHYRCEFQLLGGILMLISF